MIIRRVNFNNPQRLHLKSDKFYNKNLVSKPAVHKRNFKQIDDIDLLIKREEKNTKHYNDAIKQYYEQWSEQIKQLEDEEKDIVIMFIEHSINRKLTPEEKIELKKLI